MADKKKKPLPAPEAPATQKISKEELAALIKKAADLSNFEVESVEVILRGLCPACSSTAVETK